MYQSSDRGNSLSSKTVSSSGNLQRANELEAIVDRETAAILKDQPQEQPLKQTNLF